MEKMDKKIFLDTDILVNFIRGNEEDSNFIKESENEALLATSTITVFELFRGVYNSKLSIQEEVAVNDIIQRLEIFDFSINSAKIAAKIFNECINNNENINLQDICIARIDLSNGFSLKTNNKKHFNKIEGLELI
jgi:tRNA(fMet)-specific endonuclease VapC